MKNLKKVLCLVLAFTMLLGVMVVSTGASNFTDSDKVVNTEAVDTMVALNIINGKGDGSYFDPAGIVTRAEMAKMICVALNGGKDPQLGVSATSYTDTVGNWAAGYIEYCTNLGIVSGRGNGIFDPSGTVTGTEAAKMLLVAIGYDAAAEGFTGATWVTSVNVKANQKDLYEDLEGMDPSAGLTRDNAAQMVYNAIQAVMVKYTYQLTTVNGQLATVSVAEDVTDAPKTILAKKFDMVTKYTTLLGVSNYDSDKEKYTYDYDSTGISTDALEDITLKSTVDYTGLFGMKVKVMYKNNTAKDVYGIYAEDSKVLATGVVSGIGTVKDDSFKFGGVVYKLDTGATATTPIYEFDMDVDHISAGTGYTPLHVLAYIQSSGTSTEIAANTAAFNESKPFAVKIIDKDGDGKVDFCVATPFASVNKVSYVGSTSVTATQSYKFEDCDIYDGIAKNDYAVIYAADKTAKGKVTLTKATVVEGAATAVESTTKVYIDGTAYTQSTFGFNGSNPSFSLGSSYKLVVVNGYYFKADKVSTSASSTNVCLVTAVGDRDTTVGDTQNAQLLFANGTKSVVKVYSVTDTNNNEVKVSNTEMTTGNNRGVVYTYEINSDGYYELTAIDGEDYDAAVTAATVTSIKDGKAVASGTGDSGTYYFADDAVVFYTNASNAYKVTTGATVNKWADIDTDFGDSVFYANKTSGFNYTQLAYLNMGATPDSGDMSYGFITATPTLVKDGDDYYLKLTIWDGSTTSTYLADSYYNYDVDNDGTATDHTFTDVTGNTSSHMPDYVKKGAPVVFSDNGDGTITNVYSFKAASNAVVGYTDGSEDVAFASDPVGGTTAKTATITDDTVILYVDTENNAGVAGGSITIADEPHDNDYTLNCYVLVNTADEIKVIVMDTANDLA